MTACAHHAVRLLDACPWCGKPTSYESLRLPTNACKRCGKDASKYSFEEYPVLPIELLAAKVVSAVLSFWQTVPRNLRKVCEDIQIPPWSDEHGDSIPRHFDFFIWSQQRAFNVFEKSVYQNKTFDPLKSIVTPWYDATLNLQTEWGMGTRWYSFLKILRVAHAIENGAGFWDALRMHSPQFKPT